jgi:DnaK suppressor protein
MALSKKQLAHLKDLIQAERERLANAFQVENENMVLKDDERSDEVDQANADYERAKMLRFRNRDVFYAKKLKKALDKIEEGDYAICEDCGADIRFERLVARPTAELCIVCKDEAEREELSNILGRQSKSLGKKIDLVTSL